MFRDRTINKTKTALKTKRNKIVASSGTVVVVVSMNSPSATHATALKAST